MRAGRNEYDAAMPCRGGLPFYRKAVKKSGALKECFEFCTSKGLDLFGFVNQRSECRCGASIENHKFWGKYQDKAQARGLQLSSEGPFSEKVSKYGESLPCDGVEVFQFVTWKEKVEASGLSFERSKDDDKYIHAIAASGY